MRSLRTLVRLARDEVAQYSRGLRGLGEAIAAIEARIEALGHEADAERRTAIELPGGAALLATYLDANRARRAGLEAERARLERTREEELARLHARRLELKRLEVLIERRAARARLAERERERRVLDDLAMIRAAQPREV